MKGWVKVVLGIAATFLFLAGLAAVQLVRSGKWDQIRGFSGGMVGITRSAKAMERLDQDHPFQPPADGLLPEPRLLAALEVCEALKPVGDPALAWMREHAGKQGDFGDAVEAVGVMARLFDTAAQELAKRQMSAREFGWILSTVQAARREASERAGAPKALELLRDLRRAAKDPGLDPGLRADLERRITGYETWLATDKGSPGPNVLLCQRHAERIQAADLGELGEVLREGMSQGKGRSRRQGT